VLTGNWPHGGTALRYVILRTLPGGAQVPAGAPPACGQPLGPRGRHDCLAEKTVDAALCRSAYRPSTSRASMPVNAAQRSGTAACIWCPLPGAHAWTKYSQIKPEEARGTRARPHCKVRRPQLWASRKHPRSFQYTCGQRMLFRRPL
jgi:hypothetical protein